MWLNECIAVHQKQVAKTITVCFHIKKGNEA